MIVRLWKYLCIYWEFKKCILWYLKIVTDVYFIFAVVIDENLNLQSNRDTFALGKLW